MNIIKEFEYFLEQEIQSNKVELYNEAGLQFEFGMFLKIKYPNSTIEFERNISNLGINKKDYNYHKSELDLLINRKIGIEFKFPKNKAFPKRSYQALQDVCFLEKLKKKINMEGYSIFITPLYQFFDGKEIDGIYKYLRKEKRIYKVNKCDVKSFMSKSLIELDIEHSYPFELKEIINYNTKYYYYIIKV